MKRLLGPEIISLLVLLFIYFLLSNICIVYDGDTFRKGFKVFRIIGIDAPEYKKKQKKWVINYIANFLNISTKRINISCLNMYGIKAKEELEKKLGLFCFNIRIEEVKKDKYGRVLAYVYKENIDIGEYLISNGFAIIYPFERFKKKDKYYEKMLEAYKNKKGLWKCIIRAK